MARTTRSAATERRYLHLAQAPHGVVVPTSPAAAAGGAGEDFDESDIWGAFAPAEPPQAGPFRAARKASPAKPSLAPDGRAAHGSLPVKIPDWSKILGSEYRPGYHYGAGGAGDWELDDDEDSVDWVPPHELAGRRRAASLSLKNGVVGRTLKVRDAVWKRTTGFQD
ncbi:protein S40-4-like [Miscanthus floridulus]|uniref:protein S40-4-like n=1 Tax=Miscanthus floridulus TaxID=154761 RepID=UPI00345958A2